MVWATVGKGGVSRYLGIAGCASVTLTSASKFVHRLRKENAQKRLKLTEMRLRWALAREDGDCSRNEGDGCGNG